MLYLWIYSRKVTEINGPELFVCFILDVIVKIEKKKVYINR